MTTSDIPMLVYFVDEGVLQLYFQQSSNFLTPTFIDLGNPQNPKKIRNL